MISEGRYVLSSEEQKAFDELKRRIKQDFKNVDDFRIYRFLKGKGFDIGYAEKVLRSNLEWREQNNIDTILKDYQPPKIAEYFPFYFSGCFDKEGSPILFLEYGNMDISGIMKSEKREKLKKYIAYVYEGAEEILEKQSEKMQKPLSKWIGIVDMANLNLFKVTNKLCLEGTMECAKFYESNYPERLKVAIVINATPLFHIMFNCVKPLFSQVTVNKVKVFGTTGWQEELKKYIDPDEIPIYFGGNKSNIIGNRTLPHSKTVPKHLYFRSSERRLIHKPNVIKYSVKRNETIEIPHDVSVPGSCLEWEFETEKHNIGFGLFYVCHKDSKEKKLLIPVQKVDSQMQQETGTYLCSKSGTYIMKFDNSYSWFRHKEIFCRTWITLPQGDGLNNAS